MKTCLYFGKMDYPFNNASACRAIAICSLLQRLGHQVQAFGYSKDNRYVSSFFVDGISIANRRYPTNTFEFVHEFLFSRWFSKQVSKIDFNNVDYVFFTSIGFSHLRKLIKLSKKYHFLLVYDCCDHALTNQTGSMLKKMLIGVDTFLFERQMKKVSVMAISNHIADYWNKKKCLFHFVVPCLTNNQSSRFSSKASYTPSRIITYCYCGNLGLGFQKDRLDWIVNCAAKHQSEAQLFIIGITKQEYCSFLRINVSDLPDSIVFEGRKPNSYCIKKISESDFTILFREEKESSKSGFPSKVSESLACSTPVVTNITSDLSQYLVDGVNAIVGYASSESACLAIFERSLQVTQKNRIEMHRLCAKDDPLDISRWLNKMQNDLLPSPK